MKTRKWALIAGVSLLVVGGMVIQRPARIAYHESRLRAARDRIELLTRAEPEFPDSADKDLIGSYERHRQSLVELGRICQITYKYRTIKTDSPTAKAIWQRVLTDDCPMSIDAESPAPSGDSSLTISVWCDPGDSSDWKSFFLETDVLDPPAYPDEIQDCQNVIDNFNRFSATSYGAFRTSVQGNKTFPYWIIRPLVAVTGKHPALYNENGARYKHDGYFCLTYDSPRVSCRIWFTISGPQDFSGGSKMKVIKSTSVLNVR